MVKGSVTDDRMGGLRVQKNWEHSCKITPKRANFSTAKFFVPSRISDNSDGQSARQSFVLEKFLRAQSWSGMAARHFADCNVFTTNS